MCVCLEKKAKSIDKRLTNTVIFTRSDLNHIYNVIVKLVFHTWLIFQHKINGF